MLETRPEISKMRIVNSHFEIERSLSKSFELKVECRATTKTPKDKEEKRAILTVELKIITANTEDIKISLETDVIFTFDNIPDSYDKIIEEECMPMALAKILNTVDDILICMGYAKLNLTQQIQLGNK